MTRRIPIITLALAITTFAVTKSDTFAAEGGGSHYLQGTNGDFAMGMAAPPGWYLRNEVTYFEAEIGPVSRGNFILSDFAQEAWVNTVKLIHMPDMELFGGHPGFVLSIPYVIDVVASGTAVAPATFSASGSGSGFSDPSLTGFLNWSLADHSHLSVGMTAYSDFGSYSSDRVINYGRNYWSFDPFVSYTWLHPERGHEISASGGLMFNTENEATDYQTGTEFHSDFTIAQHLPANFTVGLIGYYYQQIEDDEGDLIASIPVGSKGFRSEGYGGGVAVSWTPKIGEKNVSFTGKWLHDFEAKKRFDYDLFMLAVALKF
jgi:hypothetical protein